MNHPNQNLEIENEQLIKNIVDNQTFIPVYQQDHHPKQPYYVRCVKCGSKLTKYRDDLEYKQVYNLLKEHQKIEYTI